MPTVIVAIYDAVGGPAVSRKAGDGYTAGPTDAGIYTVASCGQHRSTRMYRDWSNVPWGTPLRLEGGELQVQMQGKWQPLKASSDVTKNEIEDYHKDLFGTKVVPSTWVFNDFGHATCYVFKDVNKNGVRDKSESIHAEFIHTTPPDEAATARKEPVLLTESHGCVHVKPADIDTMIAAGYLARGNAAVYHEYSAKAPTGSIERGRPPYAVHFYPGAQKMYVLGRKAK